MVGNEVGAIFNLVFWTLQACDYASMSLSVCFA